MMKRYDFTPGENGDLQEFSGNGRYVLYEDIVKVIKELQKYKEKDECFNPRCRNNYQE